MKNKHHQHNLQKIFVFLIALIIAISGFTICAYSATPIRSVFINPLRKASPGNSYQMTYTVSPSNASYKTKSWSVDDKCGSISNSGLLSIKGTAKAGRYRVSLSVLDTSSGKEYKSTLYVEVQTPTQTTKKVVKSTTASTSKPKTTKNKTTVTNKNVITTESVQKEKTTVKTTTSSNSKQQVSKGTTVEDVVTKIELSTSVTSQIIKGNKTFNAELGITTVEENEDESITVKMDKVNNAQGYSLYISSDGKTFKPLYSGKKNTYVAHKLSKNKQYYFKYNVYHEENSQIILSNFSNVTKYKLN